MSGALLVSSALYDADKFRWGTDNFTRTLWDMAESLGAGPDLILRYYDRGVAAIRRVRESFRTDTGKRYGPDFIDIGLELSLRIRLMLEQEL